MARFLVAVGLLAASLPAPVAARSQAELAWPLRDVFPVAVRFVRIDRGCAIVDRDPESAYLIFDCDADGKKKRGALELIAIEAPGRSVVRVQLTLTDEPRYVELRFLELLERKVKEEKGPAPPSPRPPPPPPPAHPGGPDGGP